MKIIEQLLVCLRIRSFHILLSLLWKQTQSITWPTFVIHSLITNCNCTSCSLEMEKQRSDDHWIEAIYICCKSCNLFQGFGSSKRKEYGKRKRASCGCWIFEGNRGSSQRPACSHLQQAMCTYHASLSVLFPPPFSFISSIFALMRKIIFLRCICIESSNSYAVMCYIVLYCVCRWHDAGTYDKKTKTGGPNGSIRNEKELNHNANKGLKIAVDLCGKLFTSKIISWDYRFKQSLISLMISCWIIDDLRRNQG